MDHVAIMHRRSKFIDKILCGEKTIESRWYLSRKAPWGKVKKGDRVFFKLSGDKIIACAEVAKVEQHEFLSNQKAREIIRTYAQQIGFKKNKISKYYKAYANKKFCVLIFLKNPKRITPFKIDKSGFGLSSAWLCVENINQIKI